MKSGGHEQIARFAHVIDIDENTSTKIKLDCARVLEGCKKVVVIRRKFNAVMKKQVCTIAIEIINKIGVLRSGSSTIVA